MIDIKNTDKNWIEKVSKKNKNADKILVEKVIRAFALLEGLTKSNINFVFRGGTSLMLLQGMSKRLSIDIDIIIPKKELFLDTELEKIAVDYDFLRVEQQNRTTESLIKKLHYKFFYKPFLKTSNEEEYILLDILFEEIPYSIITKKVIDSPFLLNKEPFYYVNIPCVEDILGEKLTAFAPNTIGIPYYKNGDSMSMEIIKQLYDISGLFDIASDINVIRNTFEKVSNAELKYLDNKFTTIDVLNDIFQTSLCLATRGVLGNGDFANLQNGIIRIKNFLFLEIYHIDKAIVSSSKVAYLSMLIINRSKTIEKYKNTTQVKDWIISNSKFTKLNKLKKTSPEAFFYWYKAIGM